ncbi:MAG TPA: DsbA family protein [Candidatus Thermoplasmatota archaeon]|nr:DsbA family protein [Candidatus Thermoplasmatota archaeon]
MAEHSHAPRIHVVHATSPACHWSWGYEAVVQRLKLVYGDQIDLTLRLGCPYEDREQWLVDYGMTAQEATDWVNAEIPALMGVPVAPIRWETQPKSCMPAVLAVQAARRQDEERAWRLSRELVRRYVTEAIDITKDDIILDAVQAVGLDAKRFQADYAQKAALRKEYEQQGSRGPPVHVGFYNFVVTDGGNRRVVLDYSFDPRDIEGAIDYLSGGTLKKRQPTDIVGYLRANGLAPLSEIGRVFDFPDGRAATEALEKLEKAGKIERQTLAGAPHWRATA